MFSTISWIFGGSDSTVQEKPVLPQRYKTVTLGLEALSEASEKNIGASEIHPLITFSNEIKLIKKHFKPTKEKFENPEKENIFHFCNALINERQQGPKLAGVNENVFFEIKEIKENIAKIIYLTDRDVSGTCEMLKIDQISESLDKISAAFDDYMNQANKTLDELAIQYKASGVQDPLMVLEVQKPIVIADILSTSLGSVNIGLIDLIKKRFLSSDTKEWELDLACVLNRLSHSRPLMDKIDQIEAPISSKLDINQQLKLFLNLHSDDVISRKHAVTAALATLFSHLREGPLSSCFATTFGIELLDQRLGDSCMDFQQMIKHGKLSRHLKNEKKYFPYVAKIVDLDLVKEVSIDRNGNNIHSELSIAQFPGIVKACQHMKIDGPFEHLEYVIKNLFQERKENQLTTTPEAIIRAFAKAKYGFGETSEIEFDLIVEKGLFAFSSATNSLLLRLWETCLAGMVKETPKSLLQHELYESIDYGISNIIQNEQQMYSKATQIFLNTFEKIFFKHANFFYDSKVPLSETSSEETLTSGAYELFNLKGGNSGKTRIRSPEDFKKLIAEVVDDVKIELKNIHAPKKEHKVFKKIIHRIQQHVKEDDFVQRVMVKHAFMYTNKIDEEVLNGWEKNPHLPWLDRTESLASKISPVHIEAKSNDLSYKFTPKDGKEIFKKTIQFIKSEKNVEQEYPTTISGLHEFSLLAKNGNLTPFLKASPGELDQKIEERMVRPVLEIADGKVEESTKNILIEYVLDRFVNPESPFKVYAEKIDWKKMSLYDFYQHLFRLVVKNSSADPQEINRRLNNCLLQEALPKSAAALLQKYAICVFDTNWDEGDKNKQFGFFFNPATKKINLMDTDGETLWIQNETEYLSRQWLIQRTLKDAPKRNRMGKNLKIKTAN